MMYHYRTAQFLPISVEEAWRFFSSAKNLAVITPPELDFRILTELDDREIYEGMLINYKVRPLFGIPLSWQTQIAKVDPGVSFMDRQIKGPYKVWEHTHTFIPQDNGLLMKDEVAYELPFGVIGRATHALIVKKKVEDIFSFRRQVLKNMFGSRSGK
jgi:ligand-binding SRPBCC domain-containing protein